ncbi:MAG: M1 family aminopeptidase [Sumerlaeia bacterium]
MKSLAFLLVTSQLCLPLFNSLNAKPLEAPPEKLLLNHTALQEPVDSFSFFLEEEKHEPYLAVYLELKDVGERPYLFINGERQITRPILRGEGLVYPIDATLLNLNALNQLEVHSLEGTHFPLEACQIVTLEGSFEELHLQQFLGDSTKLAPPQHPSQVNYDVDSYRLELDVDANSRFLDAEVTITATSLVNNLGTVAFDFSDADFSGQSLTITGIELNGTTDVVANSTIDRANNWLIITFPTGTEPNLNDQFSFKVTYNGSPGFGLGAFGLQTYNRDIRTNGSPVVYSFSEPYGARTWWPCKDVPSDKALLDVIITTQDSYDAVSNGALISTVPVIGNKTRYFWSHQYPISTYLVAFCVSDYDYYGGTYTSQDSLTTMPVGHYIFSESTDSTTAYIATIDTVDFFASVFGEYPYLNEKYVTMTWGGGFGMEHSTATSTNKNDMRTSNGGGYSRRNVHELAHQWFGNYVTPVNFDHIWLNEGFATYCEALSQEARNGSAAYFSAVNNFISSGINDNTPIVNSNADAFQLSLVYRKAAVVLHMLRRVMGDDDFFTGTKNYLANNAYSAVDTEVFEAAMEAQEGTELDWFFDQWIHGTGKPNYEFGWSQTANTLDVTINQTTTPFFRMPVDLQINYFNGGSEVQVVENTTLNQSFQLTVSSAVESVEFDPEGWIYKGGVVEPNKPNAPVLQYARKAGSGSIELAWDQPVGTTVTGFRIQRSIDGENWTTEVDETTLTNSTFSYTLANQPLEASYRVVAMNSGTASDTTDPYAVAQKLIVDSTKILIVDGYDRVQAWSNPNQPFTQLHGTALWPLDVQFDSCANEAVVDGDLLLTDYDVIIWQASEESTNDIPFNTTEQGLVEAYLQQGGKLFVSGSEIGWSHGRGASAVAATTFYNTVLKTEYIADDANSYELNGAVGSAFEGLVLTLDDTGTETYRAEFNDSITTSNGSTVCFRYGNNLIAGVQYKGLFPSGTTSGALISFGFPFETILTQTSRTLVMEDVLTYFEFTEPNPGNSVVDELLIF